MTCGLKIPGTIQVYWNLRAHRYFGSPLKDSARFLFDFWANARRGDRPALKDTACSDSFQTTS